MRAANRKWCVCLLLGVAMGVWAQEVRVERLGVLDEVELKFEEGLGVEPVGILVDEVRKEIWFLRETYNGCWVVTIGDEGRVEDEVRKERFISVGLGTYYRLGRYAIGTGRGGGVEILKDPEEEILNVVGGEEGFIGKGFIYVILKGGEDGYVVCSCDGDGTPVALDTEGRVYRGKEVIGLLRELDPEKYEASVRRAEELGLREAFEEGRALVWGRTYYDTPHRLHEYWGEWLFKSESEPVFSDDQGNLYQLYTNYEEDGGSEFVVVGPDGEYLVRDLHVTDGSEILGRSSNEEGVMGRSSYESNVYVGFGGNVYFYVAGLLYTEVFRIRRTWGEPSIYALAVNGYTDDWYGAYVDKVLEEMSDEELRLLRNCVYALYGYVFKDEGLREYFEKQVWYEPDPGVDPGTLELPAERRRLVERVLQEERKRGLRK